MVVTAWCVFRQWTLRRPLSSCAECRFASIEPSGWIIPRTATATTALFGASPHCFDLGSDQSSIDAVQSINSVPIRRHHQSDLPNLRTHPADWYLSPFLLCTTLSFATFLRLTPTHPVPVSRPAVSLSIRHADGPKLPKSFKQGFALLLWCSKWSDQHDVFITVRLKQLKNERPVIIALAYLAPPRCVNDVLTTNKELRFWITLD